MLLPNSNQLFIKETLNQVPYAVTSHQDESNNESNVNISSDEFDFIVTNIDEVETLKEDTSGLFKQSETLNVDPNLQAKFALLDASQIPAKFSSIIEDYRIDIGVASHLLKSC